MLDTLKQMSRRPPIIPRSERVFTLLDNAIVMMIRAHVGKPCPTRREIMGWTGVPRRNVWRVLGEMQGRGVIEIEVCGKADPKRRRMRVAGETWTDWTARRPVSDRMALDELVDISPPISPAPAMSVAPTPAIDEEKREDEPTPESSGPNRPERRKPTTAAGLKARVRWLDQERTDRQREVAARRNGQKTVRYRYHAGIDDEFDDGK